MGGLRSRDVVNAAVDALRADSTLTTLLGTSKVYAHVPEDTAPPYVLVMAGREVPVAQAFTDDDTRSVEAQALVVSAYRGTKQLDDVCDQVVTTLTTEATWNGLTGYLSQMFAEAERVTVEDVNGALLVFTAGDRGGVARMMACFADGHVERLTIGEPDCADYLRLLEWRRDTPGLTFENPDYHRLQLEHWVWSRLQPTPRNERVLDIGVDDRKDWVGPNYSTFGPPDSNADVVGDLLTPGALGPAWDVILCTEVLEHCAHPIDALRRIYDALRPGGRLLASSPFLWPDHRTEDYPDYFRFTEQGWRLLCREFGEVTVTPCHWTPSGACALHLLRQAEGMGFAAQTWATTGYLVEAVE